MKTHLPQDDKPTSRLVSAPEEASGTSEDRSASWRYAQWAADVRAASDATQRWAMRTSRTLWRSPAALRVRRQALAARRAPWSGAAVILSGAVLVTLFIVVIDHLTFLPNRGVIYFPVIAFIAYYWDWRHGALAALLDLFCIYLFLTPPFDTFKPLTPTLMAPLLTNAAAVAFVLAVVQLAANRRAAVEREAARFASLTSVGLALAGELNEERLLRLIARTACDLTGAGFAAFTLRPLDASGRPVAAARGDLFHLAAVVGVTPEQEALFKRMPLGGEGLLAPIFRFGRAVRVADALMSVYAPTGDDDGSSGSALIQRREAASNLARAYSHGAVSAADLKGVGAPRGHPVVRSFLGAPLLDRMGDVRGGLLLGHSEPDRFTAEDERLLQGLAAQAATALENARLYRAARSQAQELDVIFESIADGVTLVDAQGQVVRENSAAKALRESVAASGTDALPDLAQAGASTSANSALLSATVAGEPREYAVSVVPVSNSSDEAYGEGTNADAVAEMRAGAVVAWHDVTATQQLVAERRARAETDARRALLQVVVDELPSGVYLVYGAEARLALANRAALDVWGGQWQVGQPMVEFLHEHGTRVVRPDSQPLPLEELATLRAVRTGKPVRQHQEIIVRADGSASPVLFNAVAVRSDLLHLIGSETSDTASAGEHMAVVVLQDVTALKAAERLKDEFIAMAAHELRTPMAAVKGYAEMLQRGARGDQGAPLAEWQREALDSIDLATTRLVDLTNDLLDVSRLQANRLELRREPHDLLALARRVARRFQVTTQRHHIITQSSQDYVVANIDAPRMEQIIGNLLSNAIKYSPDGGDILLNVIADELAGEARVSVRDAGIGIPVEEQARLFARFARAENARELGIGGTGLGLYLCRELLAQLGGRIWFESAEGAGTTFYFDVPLHHAEDDLAAE